MSGDIVRILGENRQTTANSTLSNEDWLDFLSQERNRCIDRLRDLDKILVKHGRLRRETLPKRAR